ncbi:hypothetical protein [Streptacidiphilus pinicola]|uniref:hypothetical protein n=1 Tax=Streptacidiphilus pinicola TaxID=2219663 RepID=UPI0010579DEB|nr:hypothetical protein [Streptacidiphilus pinicola]
MIADANPETLDSVAAKWAAVDLALQRAQEDLLHHTTAATTHWTGSAADAFTARATVLHHALGAGASYASHASSGVSYAADALRTARYDMPPEPASLDGVVTAEQAQATGTAVDALHEQQRRKAVTVMETLERRYAAASEMIGTPQTSRISFDHGTFPDSPPRSVNLSPAEKADFPSGQASKMDIPVRNGLIPAQGRAPENNTQGPDSLSKMSNDTETASSTTLTSDSYQSSSQGYDPGESSKEGAGARLEQQMVVPSSIDRSTGEPPAHALDTTPATALRGQSQTIRHQLKSWPPERDSSTLPLASKNQARTTTNTERSSRGLRFKVGRSGAIEKNQRIGTSAPIPEVIGGTACETYDVRRPIDNPATQALAAQPGEFGAPGVAMHASTGRASNQSRRRPQYLSEDPQHWIDPSKSNPHVIDR